MSQSDMPPIPVTGAELVARWASRDAEYAKRRIPLPPTLIEAIRDGRKREASLLPEVSERARLYGRAETWMPPVHAEFGGMQDFLGD